MMCLFAVIDSILIYECFAVLKGVVFVVHIPCCIRKSSMFYFLREIFKNRAPFDR
jgi:hypothetical protein